MKTKYKSLIYSAIITIAMVFSMMFGMLPNNVTSVYASSRDRDIIAVNSLNSLNMSISETGTLTWDNVDGATGYQVVLKNSNLQEVANWENSLTNNRVLSIISEMDNNKCDSGRYIIEVVPRGAGSKVSMTYYYTSNVDKLEAPTNLQWIGNNAVWDYVEGASSYEVKLFNFSGIVSEATRSVTTNPVDFSSYNPQDGWTFTVQAKGNGTLNDKRASNIAESPKKGTAERTINAVNSSNSLNMSISETGTLTWDAVDGATGYQVVLKDLNLQEITSWENNLTNNRVLSIISEMDNNKYKSGSYVIEVIPRGAGSNVAMTYYYTSNVEQFAEPKNLNWAGSQANWTAVDGVSSYSIALYNFEGQVVNSTTTEDWYDFSSYNPQDGWTFTVQAVGNGTLNAKRNSTIAESPAKTTEYSITCRAYQNFGSVTLTTTDGTTEAQTYISETALKNTEVSVTAQPILGYEFVAWRIDAPEQPSATCSTNATYTFNATQNIILFAVFQPIPTEFTISYDGNGASGYMQSDVVNAGGTYILEECTFATPYGYQFAGWAIDDVNATPLKQPNDEIIVNKNTTIYAIWEHQYIYTSQPTNVEGKIGANIQVSVGIDNEQIPNDNNANIILELFDGENWNKVNEAKRSEWTGYFNVVNNTTCTKTYRYKVYNGTEWIISDEFEVEFLPLVVTFVDNEHSTITEPINVEEYNTLITQPVIPVFAGDKFISWNNIIGSQVFDFANNRVTQDITLYANWAGRGFYSDFADIYAQLGTKARIYLTNVNFNNTYTYVYKYNGEDWVQVVNITNYGWYDLSASDVEKTEKYKIVIEFSTPIESNEFNVTWTANMPTYTVAYSGNGDLGGSMIGDVVQYGGTFELEECEFVAPEGKQFKCWAIGSLNGEQKQPGETITITEDTYIYAIWEDFVPEATGITATYTGTILSGTTINPSGIQITMDYSNAPSTPVNAGAVEYWYNGTQITNPTTYVFGVELIGNLNITIKYQGFETTMAVQIVGHTITFDANNGTGTMASVEYVGAYTLPANEFTAPTGKQFKAWNVNGIEKQPGDAITISEDTIIIAVWEIIDDSIIYTIKITGMPDVVLGADIPTDKNILTISNDAKYEIKTMAWYDYTEEVWVGVGDKFISGHSYQFSVDLIAKDDYEFASQGEITATINGISAVVNKNGLTVMVCLLVGTPIEYTITFNAGDGTGSMDEVITGGNYTLPECTFEAPTGKVFDKWNITGIGDKNAGDVIMITEDITITALWKDKPVVYTITFNAGGGSGSMNEVEIESGDVYSLPNCLFTSANEYLVFDHWEVSEVGSREVGYNLTVLKNYTITAIWVHKCKLTPVQEVSANCATETNGKEAHYICNGCDNKYSDENGEHLIQNFESWGIIQFSHNFTGELVIHNASTHGHKCVNANCEKVGEFEQHSFTTWDSNAETHWNICACGQTGNLANHSNPQKVTGKSATCTEFGWNDYYQCECGKLFSDENCEHIIEDLEAWKIGDGKINYIHNHTSEWKSDESKHWNECDCGDSKTNENNHVDSDNNGKCDTCDYQMETQTPPPSNPEKKGIGAGAIVAIVIVSTLALGTGGFAVFWFVIKKKTWADFLAIFNKK